MLVKTGTYYYDMSASHYILLHPRDEAAVDDDDPLLPDSAQDPTTLGRPWRLGESARWLMSDPGIAAARREQDIGPRQVGGMWVFAACDPAAGRLMPAFATMARMGS